MVIIVFTKMCLLRGRTGSFKNALDESVKFLSYSLPGWLGTCLLNNLCKLDFLRLQQTENSAQSSAGSSPYCLPNRISINLLYTS